MKKYAPGMQRRLTVAAIRTTAAAALLFLNSALALAQGADSAGQAKDPHEVQPERPTVATHAGTVAPGWLEMETGGEWDRYSPREKLVTIPTTLKVGIGTREQLNLSAAGLLGTPGDPRARGIGDITIGIKYRIVDDAPFVGDFAILPSLKLPTASSARGLGTGTTDVSMLLISSHSVGNMDIDINVGGTRRSGNGSLVPPSATVWTVSAGYAFARGFGWTAEIFGFPGTSGDSGAKGTAALLTGPTYQPAIWLAFDAGMIAPFTGPQARAVFTGLVWNIGKLP